MIERERNTESSVPAHERVYRTLRTRIMHGIIPPASTLTLRGIASEFGVSMTPARESVRRLVAEGALKLTASGRVLTPDPGNERIEELAALRALLEPEMASRALPRAHTALVERMQSINGVIEQMIHDNDAVGYVRTNFEFHRTLYLRAHAPAMLAMLETVWLQSGPTMRVLYERTHGRRATETHRKIIAALRAGDEPGLRLAVRTDATEGLRHLTG